MAPFKSEAQRRFFNSPRATAAGLKPSTVEEFNKASVGMKLPDHVKPKFSGIKKKIKKV
jgi:hypothetical protein